MVLHHVAKRARPVIITPPALEPDRLGDGDLHMIDVSAIPERLEHQVGEAQREQVLDGFLPQIMVDPEGPLFRECRGDGVVDLAARFKVGAERLLQRHSHRRAGQPRSLEPVDRRLEQRRSG